MKKTRTTAIAVFLVITFGLYWSSYLWFKSQELEKAGARLTLYSRTVEAELEKFCTSAILVIVGSYCHTDIIRRRAGGIKPAACTILPERGN